MPTRPINPQQEVSRYIYNLPPNQSAPSSPSLFKTSNISCRGQHGNQEDLALEKKKKKSFVLKYIYPQQETAVHLFSIIPDLPLFHSFGGEEDRREERDSLSLRPECLAVFKWHTRTCFCLPRQIHCEGRWANTHTHILT